MEKAKSFEFTTENLEKSKKIIDKYPADRKKSAVMPLLYLAQEQNDGWVSKEVMDHIAIILDLAPIRVYEVASFYTMYNLDPVGKNFIQICTTTPCMLRGSDDIVKSCKDNLGIDIGETTEDGEFTIVEVECLGACVNAPIVQINNDYYEDLDYKSMGNIIQSIKNNVPITLGSQNGRKSSAPFAADVSQTSRQENIKNSSTITNSDIDNKDL